jgi:DNA helicase II / ATP-dependent DNA helicase PcrA
LFTGEFASARAQDDYESAEHFLLKPFLKTIYPLVVAWQKDQSRVAIDILRRDSPSFDIRGTNSKRSLQEMIEISRKVLVELIRVWSTSSIRDVLEFCRNHQLIRISDRLKDQLLRQPRQEVYSDENHSEEKGDWLCDEFFESKPHELTAFCEFIQLNSVFSTQHGVKGEEYRDVLVIFDDVEAAWSHYSFTKLLTPNTAGVPTPGQLERGRKLAYVCFSRAEENLRILLFTPKPQDARKELIDKFLLAPEQILILA